MYNQQPQKIKPIPKATPTPTPDDDREVDLDQWDDIVADRYKVPRSLMKSVRSQESGGNVNAVSPTGVRGRYQVTEATAKQYGLDRNDPWQQSVAAAKHLRAQYDSLKDVTDDDEKWLGAVGRYYGGGDAVKGGVLSGSSVDGVSNPAEHVRRVAEKWGQFRKQEGGQSQPRQQQPAAAPVRPSGSFQPPVSMDFRAPTEAQTMADKAIATTQPKPRVTPKRPTLGQLRSQATQFTPPAETLQPVTGEQRQAASQQFLAQLEADKRQQQAAAKAKMEAEAARASKNTLGKMGSHLVRGAVSGAATTPLRMASMTDPTSMGRKIFAETAQNVEDKTAEYFPVDQTKPATLNVFKPEFYSMENIGKAATENVPEVVGQMLPQMLLSRGAGGLARMAAPELAAATALPRVSAAMTGGELASRVAGGGLGAVQQAQQAYQNAIAAGMSHEQALQAAAIEAPIGFSEVLGAPGTLGVTRPGAAIGREMKEEGLQELFQSGASGLAAKYASGYDPNRPLTDIAGEAIGGGALGAVTGGIVAAPGARIQQRAQARQLAGNRAAIDERSAANAAAINPITEPLTEPLSRTAAAAQPATPASAISPTVTAPIPSTFEPSGIPPVAAESQPSAIDRSQFPEGETGDLQFYVAGLQEAQKPQKAAPVKAEKPDPTASVQDFNNAALNKKVDAEEAAKVGNWEAARDHYKAAMDALTEVQKVARRTKNADLVANVGSEKSAVNTLYQTAKTRAAQMAKQANAPTAPISRQVPQNIEPAPQNIDAAAVNPPQEAQPSDDQWYQSLPQKQRDILDMHWQGLRPSAIQRQLKGTGYGEITKIIDEYNQRGKPQPVESAPLLRPEAVQNPEGGIPRTPTKSFNQIAEEVETEFKPDTADLREVREFGRKEPEPEGFTEEPPEQRETGRRITPFRPPSPSAPRQVGNRPMSMDVAGIRTPTAMSAEFPRARRAMVQAGREVQSKIEAGQERGEFGKVAEAMFKSNTPETLHGQDSFFHDPDLKGKLGLTRDAEMADVRRELKTQLARSLGVKVGEVSLSHIKPDVWRAFARQKGLGDVAVKKLEAGIRRAERKEYAITQAANQSAEGSKQAQEKSPTPQAETAPIKTGDSVTWQRGDKTEFGKILKIVGGYATVEKADGSRPTVPVSKLMATEGTGERQKDAFQLSRLEENEGFADAAVNVRIRQPKTESRANTIYGNEQAQFFINRAEQRMNERFAQQKGEVYVPTVMHGANLSTKEAYDFAKEIQKEKYFWKDESPEVKAAADKAIDGLSAAFEDTANQYGRVLYVAGNRGFSSIRGTVYHELAHDAERKYTTTKNWFESQMESEKIADALEARGYSPDQYVSEAVAHIVGGQGELLGLSDDQAVDFLDSYLSNITFRAGREATAAFKPHLASPNVRPVIREAQRKYGAESRVQESGRAIPIQPAERATDRRLAERSQEGAEARRQKGAEAMAQGAQKGRVSFGSLANEPTGEVLGAGLGVLQKMLGRTSKVETPEAVPNDWDVNKFIGKISKQILPQKAKDGSTKPPAMKLTGEQSKEVMAGIKRMMAGAKNEDFVEIFKAREDVRKAMFPELKRDVKWFDHLQSRLSNVNFRGTYERIAGRQGKEISEIFRNAQVDAANNKITRGQAVARLNKELRPYIQRLKLGGKPGLARWVEMHIDAISDPDASFRGLAGYLKGFNFYTLLAYNPRSTFVNKLQPLQTLWPHVTSREYMKLLGQARNPKIRERVLEIAKKESGGNTERPEDKTQIWTLFGRVSDSNRVLGHLAGEMFADRQGLKGEAKERMAADWAKKVEFDTSQYDVPPLFAKPLASVLGQFKSFQIKNLERIYADWKSAAPETLASGAGPNAGKIARRAKMVAAQVAIGGARSAVPGLKHIGGVLMLGLLAKGLSAAGFGDEWGEKIAEAVYFGAPGLIDQDLSGSVMLFDEPFGKTPYEKAVNFTLGPSVARAVTLYDIGTDAYDPAMKMWKGTADEKDTDKLKSYGLKAARTITPLTKTAVVGVNAAQGKTPNMWLGKETPMNLKETIGYGLGGTPLRQTKFYESKETPAFLKSQWPERFPAATAEAKKTRVTETGDIESLMPKQKKGEPESVYKQRVERVEKWMEDYGQKLIDHPRYKVMSPEMQEKALKNLRGRIGDKQNERRPKLDRTGQIESFNASKVLESVQRSAREKPKSDAKKLWVAP